MPVSKGRKKSTKKKAQQRWSLWAAAGVVVLAGIGFTLYQQNIASTLLLSKVGLQCELTKKIAKSVTDFKTATATPKPESDKSLSAAIKAAKDTATAQLKPSDCKGVSNITLNCPNGCSPSGLTDGPTFATDQPYCEPVGNPKLVPAPGSKTPNVWSATQRCRRSCEWSKSCTIAAKPTPGLSISPKPECQNGEDDDGDSATDFPADKGCISKYGNNEKELDKPPTTLPKPKPPSTPWNYPGISGAMYPVVP